MQLKTVLESSPHVWMPSFGNFTIHFSPRVTLVHLAANVIPLGLHITGQEVPQKLVHLSNFLAVSFLGFLEHLLGLLNLQQAGLHIILGLDGSLGPSSLLEIFNVPASLSTALASFLHFTSSPFWLMRCRTATTCASYSLVYPREKMDMLKTVPSGSLILRVSGASLVFTRSIGGTYGMGG
jgi:hypothetical protein